MSKADVEKNFTLSGSFTSYTLKNPKVLKDIPRNACIVMTSKSFPSLSKRNIEIAEKIMKERKVACYKAEKVAKGWTIIKLSFAR